MSRMLVQYSGVTARFTSRFVSHAKSERDPAEGFTCPANIWALKKNVYNESIEVDLCFKKN